jgi:pimeloyl-ACP methyl ester carboxylesterase
MERRNFLGALTAASLGLALNSSLPDFAQARNTPEGDSKQPDAMPGDASMKRSARTKPKMGTGEFPDNATVILVHAAWADGYCWSNIILPLERRGLKVICAPIPLTTLSKDASALSWAVERATGPVVLVGHAYSGAVIAATNEGQTKEGRTNDRIKSLVYIAALAPDEGETVAKVFYRDPPHPEAPTLAPDSHGLIWMPEDRFHRAVAQKASLDQTKIAAAVQRPIALQCIQDPAPTPLWKSKPSWFLIAEEDRMINPKTQHFMADRMGATVHSHPVDHTPMYSAPAVVVDIILEAARKTLSQ